MEIIRSGIFICILLRKRSLCSRSQSAPKKKKKKGRNTHQSHHSPDSSQTLHLVVLSSCAIFFAFSSFPSFEPAAVPAYGLIPSPFPSLPFLSHAMTHTVQHLTSNARCVMSHFSVLFILCVEPVQRSSLPGRLLWSDVIISFCPAGCGSSSCQRCTS